jgi:hypothetical protein
MKWSATAAALLIAAAPMAAASQQSSAQPRAAAAGSDTQRITLHGCVRPGIEKDTFLMTDVTEPTEPAVPPEAHGRKVIFWLDNDAGLKPHVGHMVEVSGTTGTIQKSEIELKAGHQKEGGLVVEFEGPGKDVKASNAVVGGALGTSGRTTSEKDDVKTFLFKVKVENVKAIAGACPAAR